MSNKNEEKGIEINDKNINEKETSENINNEATQRKNLHLRNSSRLPTSR